MRPRNPRYNIAIDSPKRSQSSRPSARPWPKMARKIAETNPIFSSVAVGSVAHLHALRRNEPNSEPHQPPHLALCKSCKLG
jgi:hypothetical protein